jgi:16S rRNA (cytosine967-C5)-methyltransferase
MPRISETDLDAWLARLAPEVRGRPGRQPAGVHNHPSVDRPSVCGSARRRPRRHRPAADRGQPAAAVHLWRSAGPGRRGRARDEVGGVPGPSRRTRSTSAADRRPSSRLSPTAARTCRTRARHWSRPRCWPRRSKAPTTRGWTCARARAGKAGLLGSIAALRGAEVTAVEVADHRARLVEQATVGLPVTVLPTTAAPSAATDLPEEGFDRLLVGRAVHRAGLPAPAAGITLAAHSPTCRHSPAAAGTAGGGVRARYARGGVVAK